MKHIVGLCILFILMALLLKCHLHKRDFFTPSKTPLDQENTLFLNSPIDNLDYQTPVFLSI